MTSPTGAARVRFAPSPTGFLHVGGARTAIYNELLRRSVGGAFILRIEDTDRERSDEAMTRQIQEGLRWLGVEWDEGPFLQSERLERHRQAAMQLVASGRAYRCFCPTEVLDEQRRAAERVGLTYRYPRTCEQLPVEEVSRRVDAGEPFVIRFRMNDENCRFHDLVRGDVDFPPDALGDFVLLRSDGSPTYHLSVVCDDIDMGVTHVIRGEDHLSNTPKHIPLFEALGATTPTFAHLPLILGPDKRRLSKRTGATSVEEFRDQGILAVALYNYLALLGWSPGGDRELLTKAEMVELFTVDRLGTSASVFDPDKLGWMNAQYMSGLPLEELLAAFEPFRQAAGLPSQREDLRLAPAVDLHRTRARNLVELAEMVRPYFLDEIPYPEELLARHRAEPALPDQIEVLAGRYAALPHFGVAEVEAELRAVAEELGVKAGVLIHPTRLALSGAKAGPSLFDLVAVMGQARAVHHLRRLAATLRS